MLEVQVQNLQFGWNGFNAMEAKRRSANVPIRRGVLDVSAVIPKMSSFNVQLHSLQAAR